MKKKLMLAFLLALATLLCACTTPTEIDEETVIALHDNIAIDVYLQYPLREGQPSQQESLNFTDYVIQTCGIDKLYPIFEHDPNVDTYKFFEGICHSIYEQFGYDEVIFAVSGDEFRALYKTFFGKDVDVHGYYAGQDFPIHFDYNEESDCFYLDTGIDMDSTGPSRNKDHSHRKITDYYLEGENLIICDIYAFYVPFEPHWGPNIAYIARIFPNYRYDFVTEDTEDLIDEYQIIFSSTDGEKYVEGAENNRDNYKDDPDSDYNKLMRGEFDDVLFEWKHTFAKNDRGEWIRVKTELIKTESVSDVE